MKVGRGTTKHVSGLSNWGWRFRKKQAEGLGDRLGEVKKFALNKLSLKQLSLSFKQLLKSLVETSSQQLDRRNLKVRQRPELATQMSP